VTHDQEEALSMAGRVAVMSQGRVLQIAGPRELYESPNCREVAEFIGSMNFFEGDVEGVGNEGATVDAGAIGRLQITKPPSFVKPGGKVHLALRPEKISLVENDGLNGSVVAVTYLGERSHLRVAVEGVSRPLDVTVQSDAGRHYFYEAGAQVRLRWSPDAFVVLER
jgi:spermidine/putrescine transport system ATP-binding protein/putrescine transport system ATP-binding protein